MKIIKKKFDAYARSQGYEDGAKLLDDYGYDKELCECYATGDSINGSMLKILCMDMGSSEVMDFVHFSPSDYNRYSHILEEY